MLSLQSVQSCRNNPSGWHAVGLRSEAGAVGLRFEGAVGRRSDAGAVGLMRRGRF